MRCPSSQSLSHYFGHPWLFDKNVQHDAYQNTYSFMMCSREIKLVLARDSPMTKLKQISGPFLAKVWIPFPTDYWVLLQTGRSRVSQEGGELIPYLAWSDMKHPLQKLKNRAKPRKKPFLVQEQVSMVVN